MEIINKKGRSALQVAVRAGGMCAGRLYRLSSGLGELFTPNPG